MFKFIALTYFRRCPWHSGRQSAAYKILTVRANDLKRFWSSAGQGVKDEDNIEEVTPLCQYKNNLFFLGEVLKKRPKYMKKKEEKLNDLYDR